ncbi:hypothetical protein DSM112329_02805 [Paraconexibacter sp. AEG42_29]|uniref:DUF4175 domain-containing protein n=1 Tax=Paraconexibacter sp. AEG42_29 TaxID=2997339 RepID=A0AAU7AW71_9ACTN
MRWLAVLVVLLVLGLTLQTVGVAAGAWIALLALAAMTAGWLFLGSPFGDD